MTTNGSSGHESSGRGSAQDTGTIYDTPGTQVTVAPQHFYVVYTTGTEFFLDHTSDEDQIMFLNTDTDHNPANYPAWGWITVTTEPDGGPVILTVGEPGTLKFLGHTFGWGSDPITTIREYRRPEPHIEW